jgi:transaldolase
MIKVPASVDGVRAVRDLTGEGISVNVTLLCGIERYDAVARAYMDGLTTFVENGGDPERICSVASFFVSRIDTMVDAMISRRLAAVTDAALRTSLTTLLGTVAIANATLEAFRDHGRLRASLGEDIDDARATLEVPERAGMSLTDVTDQLLADGVTLFREAFDNLLAAVDAGRRSHAASTGRGA